MTDLLHPATGADAPDDRDGLADLAAVLPCYVDRRAATAAWLAGEDPPRSWLADLLHTEVEHDGACYGRRLANAALFGLPVAVGCDLAYAAGRLVDRGQFEVAPLGPLWTVLAVLGGAALVMLAALVRHALWHRAEAPYAFNEVLDEVDLTWGWR